MKKSFGSIARLIGAEKLVRIDRKPVDEREMHGFVVGVSVDLVLIHLVDGNSLDLDGYAAVRRSDIRKLGVDKSFAGRALQLHNRRSAIPESIDITCWSSLVRSLGNKYKLISMEQELCEPGILFIGSVASVSGKTITLSTIDAKARQLKPEKFKLKNTTRITFGDNYVKVLSTVVESATESA